MKEIVVLIDETQADNIETGSKVIKKEPDGWVLYTKDSTRKLGGPYKTREEAEERERQVQFFKHQKEGQKKEAGTRLEIPDELASDVKALEEVKQGKVSAIIGAWPKWAGSFSACVTQLEGKPGITDPKALCAWLHKQAEGKWPAEKKELESEEDEKARSEGRGAGGPRQGDGGASVCACSKCDYEVEHKKGTPCNEMKCPECDVALVGKAESETAGEQTRRALTTQTAGSVETQVKEANTSIIGRLLKGISDLKREITKAFVVHDESPETLSTKSGFKTFTGSDGRPGCSPGPPKIGRAHV